MSEGKSIVSCRDLHKSYLLDRRTMTKLDVLRGIDFEVSEGEMVSILGASGSGKSTLLHLLGGLDRPSSGSVSWRGKDIFTLDDEALASLRNREVGFIFQFHHLMPEFDALENVMIPLLIAGKPLVEAEARARELLEKVGLSARALHKPSELSGGEQQRIAVARALANGPRVVLADEPTGNLDSSSSQHLSDLLSELNRSEKQTFIIVTHNERLAERSGRVFTMVDGKLQTVGRF